MLNDSKQNNGLAMSNNAISFKQSSLQPNIDLKKAQEVS